MAIMQGDGNWVWTLAESALAVLSIVFVWYLTTIGRDRDPAKQKRGRQELDEYAEGIQGDHSPLPKFLIWTYVFVGVWTVAYVIWTGTHGFF